MARSYLLLPSMKVNGERCKESVLEPGDVLEIGPNRFRFIAD